MFFLALRPSSSRHLSATSRRRSYAFRFIFSAPFAVRTTLRSQRRILRASRRHCRLLDALIILAAWLIEAFSGTGCTDGRHSRLLLLEFVLFAARLIEIFAGAGSATRSWLVATLQCFSFSLWRSQTFWADSRASRRRGSTEFFATFAFTRFRGLRSVWGYRGSRRLH